MTDYFEFNAKRPRLDLIEPDDTLVDTGIHVQHGEMDDGIKAKFEAAYQKAIGSKS